MTKPNDTRTRAVFLAEAGWDRVLDDVLAGIVHDLNGRVASLGAVSQLAALGESVRDTFALETDRLEVLAQTVGLLVGDGTDGTDDRTPVMPKDLVERAIRVHGPARVRVDAEVELAVGDGVPPVLVAEAHLVRGLVVVLDLVARLAGGGVQVSVSGAEDEAVLVFSAGAVAAGGDGPSSSEAESGGEGLPEGEAGLEALQGLFALDGGRLSARPDGIELRLPSLSKSRGEGR